MTRFIYPDDFSKLSNFMGMSDGFSQGSIEAFEEKSKRDYDTIKDWFPSELNSVLDIGCGLGGVDILIGQNTNISVINLMDGDGTEDKKVGFNDDCKAWFDRKLARNLVAANVKCSVRAFQPNPLLTIRTDLIISLKSWGHHFPITTYLDLAKRSLRSSGRVILDIRRKHIDDATQIMKDAGFLRLHATYETPKCQRIIFYRSEI